MWNPPRGPCCARHAFLCTHTEAGERQVQVGVLPFIWLSPRASVPVLFQVSLCVARARWRGSTEEGEVGQRVLVLPRERAGPHYS